MKRRLLSPLALGDGLVIVIVWMITLWALHPSLLFSTSTITGGDTGAHVALGAYLKSHGLWHGLTPWYPGWFDGFPLYTYYFPLPDAFAALLSYVIPYTVAFKLATVLGSFLLPVAAYVMGRCFKAPRPIPAAMAASTLVFLFDVTYTIDGGNLFSTLAGEYAFSLGLALALLAIGTYVATMDRGRGRWLPAVFLALTALAHVLTFLFAVVSITLLWVLRVIERDEGSLRRVRRRATWRTLSIGLGGTGLVAWWLLPFATSQQYTNSMGYTNNPVDSASAIFSHLGWFCQPNLDGCAATSGPGADRVVIILAGLGLLLAFYKGSRLGRFLSMSAVVWLLAYIVDPQGVIWNERLVPFWYISVYLSAGWFMAQVLLAVSRSLDAWIRAAIQWFVSRHSDVDDIDGEIDNNLEDVVDVPAAESTPSSTAREGVLFGSTVVIALLAAVITLAPMVPWMSSAIGVTPGPNEVPTWASWNYSGYEHKPSWPELHGLTTTMERLTTKYGCGRAMWEYAGSGHYGDESRFGTTMALMLLPYWTNQCVGSMEGLLFESSATTPYHFINQAELSAYPSDPMVGLAYESLNVAQGVRHLQMLGVKYYLAFSATAIAQANALHTLQPLAVVPARSDAPGSVAWHIYLIKDAPLVSGLSALPNVVTGLTTRTAWLNANTSWYQTPSAWSVPLASDGPATWPHVAGIEHTRHVPVPVVHVTAIAMGGDHLSFHVDRVGVPVLVKISYFPRWHASGATGPYRVSPNLMVVLPTAHTVTLTYGATGWMRVGEIISAICAWCAARSAWRRRPWRRPLSAATRSE
jgi:hypothetical protein